MGAGVLCSSVALGAEPGAVVVSSSERPHAVTSNSNKNPAIIKGDVWERDFMGYLSGTRGGAGLKQAQANRKGGGWMKISQELICHGWTGCQAFRAFTS